MDFYMMANIAWNTGLVAVAGYMIKRWMDKVEAQLEKNCDENERSYNKLNDKIDVQESQIAAELKDRSRLYEEKEFKLYHKIDGIYEQLKIANRRTSKNEESIHLQAALCVERTRHGMANCRDDNHDMEV